MKHAKAQAHKRSIWMSC